MLQSSGKGILAVKFVSVSKGIQISIAWMCLPAYSCDTFPIMIVVIVFTFIFYFSFTEHIKNSNKKLKQLYT